MALSAGSSVGPYDIVAPLGAGGMGEVYRAHDTRLKRDVALKVLPAALSQDVDRLARFKREAQVLASLNHPHIASIYGVEESGPALCLVLELVEGDTLAGRLRHGALPVDDAIRLARQLADALGAAHESGIIHRDLKPANIALTADDQVKVLDFGLAKAIDPALPDAASSPTPRPLATQDGVILGTAAYMSPEQAKGRAADKRSDVWAFGCVFYEMLTGVTAFQGEDVLDTLTAVMRSEPDWSALPARTPAHVRTLLERCLKKNRKERIADIAVAQFLLDAPSSPPSSDPSTGRVRPWVLALVSTAALIAGAVGGVFVWRSIFKTPLTVTRFSFPLPDGQQFSRLGHQSVAISPDGTRIVYVANRQMYVRSMADPEPRAIPGTDSGAESPAFSPDGESVVFRSAENSALIRLALTGGAPVTLCPALTTFGLTWSSNGILFGQGDQGIVRVSAEGGTKDIVIAAGDREEAHGPQLLPDGDHVLFTLATSASASKWDTAQIVVQSIKSGERKVLVKGGTDGRYLSTGHLVYGLGRVLYAVPFDPRRIELTGVPIPIVEGVRDGGMFSGSMHFSVSDTGSLVYIPGPMDASSDRGELAIVDRKGAVERLKLPPRRYENPRVSPDGKSLAVNIDDGKGSDVWIYELSGVSSIRRLTFGGRDQLPVWSPDSRRIAFQSGRENEEAIFLQAADGSGKTERLTKAERGSVRSPESWSPDGAHLLLRETKGAAVSLWSYSFSEAKAEPFGDVRSTEPTNAVFSPDGRWVAYSSTEGGRRLFVQPFPATGARYEIATDAIYPVWSANGKELLWTGASVRVSTKPSFTFGNPMKRPGTGLWMPGPALPRSWDITPEGRFVGTLTRVANPDAPVAYSFQVVLNWLEELKARMPTKPRS